MQSLVEENFGRLPFLNTSSSLIQYKIFDSVIDTKFYAATYQYDNDKFFQPMKKKPDLADSVEQWWIQRGASAPTFYVLIHYLIAIYNLDSKLVTHGQLTI